MPAERVCTYCGKPGVMHVVFDNDSFHDTACLIAYGKACQAAKETYHRQMQLQLEAHFPEQPRIHVETTL